MKTLFVFFTILFLALKVTGQDLGKSIKGIIKDVQQELVPGAQVSLHRANDSSLVQGTASDLNGCFVFNQLPNGVYHLQVKSLGNNKYRSAAITVNDQQAQVILPVITLIPATTLLNEVKIVAKRPLLEQDLDKSIVHVDAIMGSAGSNSLEVLEKTPGVTVGADGEISLNGKGEVLVLIDDRPTHLSRQDLAIYLKSLPGGALDKIELMTNPPAKYDAAGSSIINIRLKKNKLEGLTGNLAMGFNQGVTGRSNNVINLNYKRRKVNFFGSVGYSKDGNYAEDATNRILFDNQNARIASVQVQNTYSYSSQGINARAGMDYTASDRTIYGFSLILQDRPRQDRLDYTSHTYNAVPALTETGKGYTLGNYTWTNLGANVNYQHKFKKPGRVVGADLNFIQYKTHGKQESPNFRTWAEGKPVLGPAFLLNLPSTIAIYTARADYQQSLQKKANLEIGIKSSMVTNDNKSDYYEVTEATSAIDHGKSNHFIYRELITAAYLNVRKDWSRLAAQVGLRAENTQANGQQLGNAVVAGSSFNRANISVFPTISFRYKADSVGRHAFIMSLSRRINRANYHQLNPFLFYRDNYSYTTGNPDLNSQYNYIGELKYQHEQILSVGLRYGHFTDLIFSTTQAVDAIFITRPENIANGKNISLSTNLTLSPSPWWNMNANITFAHLALKSRIYAESLHLQANVARLNLRNQFKLNKGWNGELVGMYGSKEIAGQKVINGRYRINAALQKEVLNKKGSIRITAEDIFYSWVQKDKTVSLTRAEAFHTGQSDTRRVGLAFTYRFGKDAFARKRKHTDNAADEEKSRVEE